MENEIALGGIGIELVRGCNFKCRMCPSSLVNDNRIVYMSRDTAELVVRRINEAGVPSAIWTFGLGESLAHPDIYEMYKIFNKIKRNDDTPVILHTNASCLTGEAAYAILEIPYVTQMYISFDGYGTQESFSYLRGGHFNEVIDNVRNFMIMAKRKRPGLYVGTCSIYPAPDLLPNIKTYTVDESESNFKSIFEPMGVHVGMRELHKYNGFYLPEILHGCEESVLPNRSILGGCLYLEEHSFEIAYDGRVRPCRDVVNEDFVIGDLHDDSFAQMVSSSLFLRLRHEMRLDNRKAFAECANCDKFSFGEDIKTASEYWKERIKRGDIIDKDELDYLSHVASLGAEVE